MAICTYIIEDKLDSFYQRTWKCLRNGGKKKNRWTLSKVNDYGHVWVSMEWLFMEQWTLALMSSKPIPWALQPIEKRGILDYQRIKIISKGLPSVRTILEVRQEKDQ